MRLSEIFEAPTVKAKEKNQKSKINMGQQVPDPI